MLLVGLTGGIGSGKSTVARLLAEHGAIVIDADAIAREIVEPGTPAYRRIVAEFGDEVVQADGTLDRTRIAQIVFADAERLARLNELTHPEVARQMSARLETVRESEALRLIDPAVVVLDVPLLVEIGGTGGVDFLVVVAASEQTQIERLARDRGMPEEAVRARVAAQAPLEEKAAVADWLVTNEGTPEELRGQVASLWKVLDAMRRGEEPPRGSPPVL